MGWKLEINDTLKLKQETGILSNLEEGKEYAFSIAERRLYNLAPTRVFLVEEVQGKWKYKGHGLVIRQTIDALTDTTSGVFKVIKLYTPEYARLAAQNEAPAGKGYTD